MKSAKFPQHTKHRYIKGDVKCHCEGASNVKSWKIIKKEIETRSRVISICEVFGVRGSSEIEHRNRNAA